ncbi:tRNA (N6-threonylcarbamoyladenosine(37)-N6)-methyltransferase TrmO [Luteococcus sp. Sow4_B9]|uniref:tRNA (N6-threonylcarbamoyladenosine(37)-N6)-methyltransferase TrmO n=1 Tax=Luteococcus sp. Sow4_B9 TaxID=3438792 RepID=UPI003F94C473
MDQQPSPAFDQAPEPTPERPAYRTIARIRSDFPSKFGVPRQSGLVPELLARVVFEPAFRSVDAVRGIDGFSHLWLLWEFDKSISSGRDWSPTVRPPRLGGHDRLGVFATRSPFRPNPIGLSSVRLVRVESDGDDAPALVVSGADLVDGTPLLDVKPYIPYDVHPEATSGFIGENPETWYAVDIPDELLARVPEGKREALLGVLAHDPRPRFMDDPGRVFGLPFAGLDVRFRIDATTVHVVDVQPLDPDAAAAWPGYR